jgi:hypothetical protein
MAVIRISKCIWSTYLYQIARNGANNYTRHGLNRLLELHGCHRMGLGEAMVANVSKKSEQNVEASKLSKHDARLLLVMCTELVNLCSRLTGKIDPAAAAMLAYVRDDIVAENRDELH